MHVWIDALSTTNESGRHVVSSQVKALRACGGDNLHLVVLHHSGNRDLKGRCGDGVEFRECPGITRHWTGRAIWERTCLRRWLIREKADLLYMTSGIALPRAPVPQVVLAMNPWCFVPEAWRSRWDRTKAAWQRRAYRQTMGEAAAMVYLSGYLRDRYHTLWGRESPYRVFYAPLADDVQAASELPTSRIAGRILCVSAMAPHKGCEMLVDVVAELACRGCDVSLALVGGWPDAHYRRTIDRRIEMTGTTKRVHVMGHLARADLLREYAGARIFAIFSSCESFGIPGVEAQAFGTPVVCSNAGAMPEVYGHGAVVVPRDDVQAAANAIEAVLGDEDAWGRLSREARLNARRFVSSGAELLSLLEGFKPEGRGRS